jgi:hypothetical protein
VVEWLALERKYGDEWEYQTIEFRGIPPFRKERGRMGHPNFCVVLKGGPTAR